MTSRSLFIKALFNVVTSQKETNYGVCIETVSYSTEEIMGTFLFDEDKSLLKFEIDVARYLKS